MYFLYLLQCGDGSIYTGITTDVERRFQEHKIGKASYYTNSRRAVKILYSEKCGNRSEALKREARVKKMSREEKLCLVKSKREKIIN